MPHRKREPNEEEGEYVVKVRKKKKRSQSHSELRRAIFNLTRDFRPLEFLKKLAIFIGVLILFGILAYFMMSPPSG